MYRALLVSVFLAAGTIWIVGCSQEESKAKRVAEPNASASVPRPMEEAHGHIAGAHGGTMVTIGAENYHAEAVFEKGGTLRLYMLGSDETKVVDVENQQLTGYVRAGGDSESTSIVIQPEPQPGDAAGKTSVFVAKLPQEFWGKQLAVTIPSLTIDKERFRLAFESSPAAGHEEQMPEKLSDNTERQLYLTPGGRYTKADIEANGNVTASQRFAGQKASHDLKPKLGDKICPITLTKANKQFTWVVGSKSYEFCCPPCVDEFVQLAKEKPEEIKEPGEYVKK